MILRNCLCALLLAIATLVFVRNWSYLNSEGKSVGIIGIHRMHTFCFLPSLVRILALMKCGKNCLTIPLHNFGGLRFLRNMMSIPTFRWSLQGRDTEQFKRVVELDFEQPQKCPKWYQLTCAAGPFQESVATVFSLFLWLHYSWMLCSEPLIVSVISAHFFNI